MILIRAYLDLFLVVYHDVTNAERGEVYVPLFLAFLRPNHQLRHIKSVVNVVKLPDKNQTNQEIDTQLISIFMR